MLIIGFLNMHANLESGTKFRMSHMSSYRINYIQIYGIKTLKLILT